jgi:hypothetical protein
VALRWHDYQDYKNVIANGLPTAEENQKLGFIIEEQRVRLVGEHSKKA